MVAKKGVSSRGKNAFAMAKEVAVVKSVDAAKLLKRRSNAKTELDLWRSLLETAYYYTIPNYNPWLNMGYGGAIAPGQQHNAGVFDLTLPIAHIKLSNKLLMGMVPQGQQWVQFVPGSSFGDTDTQLYQDALKVCQKLTDQFFRLIDRSNFYLSVAESISDVLLSTGVLSINGGTRKMPLRFEAVPASHVMFEGDPLGGIAAVFRDWYAVRVDQIKYLWPDPETKLPPNKKPDDELVIYECAYVDYETDDDSKRYVYAVITDSKFVILEKRMASWPWVVYRIRKLLGETRGRGPSLDAYPTAATINQALGDELMAAAFIANPMYMCASDSAFNPDTFVATPGAFVPVQMTQGQWPIQNFPGGGNIQFSSLVISDLRQQINDLMLVAPLGPIDSKDRTATEARIRYMDNLESFAAVVPRLQTEFFVPTIKRCLYLLSTALPEIFAEIPDEIRNRLISVDGEIIDLQFETPLMTSRGQLKTEALLSYFNALSGMIGQDSAAATFKPAKLASAVAINQAVDLDLVKSEDELNQEIQAAGDVAKNMLEQQGVAQ